MSPLNTSVPEPSLIATLWGCGSLLSKWIVNPAPAGVVTDGCSNAMFWALIWTAEAAGEDEVAGEGCTEAGIEAEAPAEEPPPEDVGLEAVAAGVPVG